MKLIVFLLFILAYSQLLANEKEQSKLFLGANVGYNLMEFYSVDDWNNWRHDFEFRKSIAFRIEYILKNNPKLTVNSNITFFNRSVDLPIVFFISPYEPTPIEQRKSEKYSIILSDIGIKYNIPIYYDISIFPKVGLYYAQRFNEKFYINEEEHKYENDNYQNNQIGFNVGGGITYKIHSIKMILEYNYFDTFNEYLPEYKQPFIFSNHFHSLNFILGYEFNLGRK